MTPSAAVHVRVYTTYLARMVSLQAPDAHGIYKIPELNSCVPPTPATTIVPPHPGALEALGVCASTFLT